MPSSNAKGSPVCGFTVDFGTSNSKLTPSPSNEDTLLPLSSPISIATKPAEIKVTLSGEVISLGSSPSTPSGDKPPGKRYSGLFSSSARPFGSAENSIIETETSPTGVKGCPSSPMNPVPAGIDNLAVAPSRILPPSVLSSLVTVATSTEERVTCPSSSTRSSTNVVASSAFSDLGTISIQ